MKRSVSFWCTAVSAVLLIPYLATIGLNGPDTALLNRIPEVENYLPAMLSLEIEDDYEAETLRCQAVIARTNLYRRLEEGENLFDIWAKEGEKIKTIYENEFFPSAFEKMEKYENAVEKTCGRVLVHENELKLVPYHQISSGMTRDGAEVLHNEEYAYLKSVDSSGDKAAPDYLSSSYVPLQQMPEKLVIETRDRAGYIMSLSADGNILEGEAFAQGMGLMSSHFTVQKVGERFRFLCKGKGHGLGFSQYGGDVLAKMGSAWEEILAVYFPEMQITDILSVKKDSL